MRLPSATAVGRRIPKEAFYKRLTLTPALRAAFTSDIAGITVANVLTKESLHLEGAAGEILVLAVVLKKKDCDMRLIEAVARQNEHRLLFLLTYEDEEMPALLRGRLRTGAWQPKEAEVLTLRGLTMDEIWDALAEDIALREEKGKKEGKTIDERLAQEERIARLALLIQRTEKAMWKEIQPKKKLALYEELERYRKEIKALSE